MGVMIAEQSFTDKILSGAVTESELEVYITLREGYRAYGFALEEELDALAGKLTLEEIEKSFDKVVAYLKSRGALRQPDQLSEEECLDVLSIIEEYRDAVKSSRGTQSTTETENGKRSKRSSNIPLSEIWEGEILFTADGEVDFSCAVEEHIKEVVMLVDRHSLSPNGEKRSKKEVIEDVLKYLYGKEMMEYDKGLIKTKPKPRQPTYINRLCTDYNHIINLCNEVFPLYLSTDDYDSIDIKPYLRESIRRDYLGVLEIIGLGQRNSARVGAYVLVWHRGMGGIDLARLTCPKYMAWFRKKFESPIKEIKNNYCFVLRMQAFLTKAAKEYKVRHGLV